MLKKEHLDFSISQGRVKPRFLKADDPAFAICAEQLLLIYREAACEHLQRKTLEELAAPLLRSAVRPKTASALNKLLLNSCVFTPAADLDYPAYRKECFAASAKLLASGISPAQTQNDIDIYGDLSDFERLNSFDGCSIEHLLDNYNMAQAQGLLFSAGEVRLTITDPEPSELRRVMKAIKFFRLLAHFRQEKKNCVTIDISGPYAIFSQSAKYAVALASVLPVLSRLVKWKLEADVQCKNRLLKLKLSDKDPLRTTKRAFSSYIPEEIRMFHRFFAEKSAGWQIVGDTPFIDAGGEEIVFPDLSFRSNSSGKIIHLELFHPWHAAQLAKRLKLLHTKPEIPLILGIDRSLVKNEEELGTLLSETPELALRCHLFRDFPGVASTCKILSRAEQSLP